MIGPLLWLCAVLGAAQEQGEHGYLWQPAFALDGLRRGQALAYQPQPGDIVLCNSADHLWKASYRLALSGPPTHSAIVVQTGPNELSLLEAGIGFHLKVELSPVAERLRAYEGEVYVRRRAAPLTAEESARLSDFASAVYKKKVPPLRFILQVTPLRARGPLRTEWLGKPHGVRPGYFCSELVVEAGVYAGILDAATARPAATYPRDLFFDHSANRYLNQHFRLADGWRPPALWTPQP